MPRSNSTTYLGNKRLKNEGVQQALTLQQVEEFNKCYNDPIYFIRNYVKIVHVDRGEIFFDLWPFQEAMVKNFMKHRFNIVKCPRQIGKCLGKDACIYIRDRETGDEKYVTIKEFYNLNKPNIFKSLRQLFQRIGCFIRSQSQILLQRVSANRPNATSGSKKACQI